MCPPYDAAMKPEQMYREIESVRQIVDTYSAVVPWGGLERQCPDRAPVEVTVDDLGSVVRALILDGRATARVVIGDRVAEVNFEHRFLGDIPVGSPLAPLAGNADSYVELSRSGASVPGLAAYLELLIESFGLQLSLMPWVLNARVVASAHAVALKTALLHFRFGCEEYRRDITAGIDAAFGKECRAVWRGELQDGNGLTEYAPLYQAFKAAGHDLAPLRTEALEIAKKLVDAGLLSQATRQSFEAKFS